MFGAQEKGKTGSKEDETEIGRKCISEFDPALSPLEGRLMYFFASFFFCLFWSLTQFSTELRVLVPCFLDITNSIVSEIFKLDKS